MKRISDKRRLREEKERALDAYLAEHRAFGRCEICGRDPDFRGLSGAHIERRDYTGANDTAGNKVIACGRCHDHSRYGKGLCITQEKAKKLVSILNKFHGIPSNLTGGSLK